MCGSTRGKNNWGVLGTPDPSHPGFAPHEFPPALDPFPPVFAADRGFVGLELFLNLLERGAGCSLEIVPLFFGGKRLLRYFEGDGNAKELLHRDLFEHNP